MFTACCHCGNDYSNKITREGDTEVVVCNECECTTKYTWSTNSLKVEVFDYNGNPLSDKRGVSLKKPEQPTTKTDEEKQESSERTDVKDSISDMIDLLNDSRLRDSLYSTFKCKQCGEKLTAVAYKAVGRAELELKCRWQHGKSIFLTIEDICAILNFSPLR